MVLQGRCRPFFRLFSLQGPLPAAFALIITERTSVASSCALRRLPLHEKHLARKARFGAFGDWEVPLYYTSILEEHKAVRSAAGVFDISHMGEFLVEGSESPAYLERILPRSMGTLEEGRALYMPILRDHGGIVDDIIVYRFGAESFLIIVNAANVEKDFEWFQSHVRGDASLVNLTEKRGLLAVQGPASPAIVSKAFGVEFAGLKNYRFAPFEEGMIARTGYTGEDGFEIMVPTERLEEVWDRLFRSGAAAGLVPVGFGARDTLRLEAGMLLYGHDMDEHTSPLEAGITWACNLEKAEFIGREALLKQKEEGIRKKRAGFRMVERGIPRQEYDIFRNGQNIGKVTSGSFSPTTQGQIGMGYVPPELAVPGETIEISIREEFRKAEIVPLPFYKRAR